MSHEERELLERIAARLDALEAKISVQPRAYKIRDAARMLGCSPTTVKGMIRAGELRTVLIGDRSHVPMAEIVRLTAVGASQPKSAPSIPRRKSVKLAQSEAEKIRALARRKD